MSEALVKSVNGKQGFVKLTTEDIPVSGDNQYMSAEDKLNLGKLEVQTRDLRTHVYGGNLHVTADILSEVQAGTAHLLDEVAHLDKTMKRKFNDHLEKPHGNGLRGLRGFPGPPGPQGSGGNVRSGSVTGQMLYWDNTVQVWEPSVVTDLGWDNTEKLLIVGSTDPSTKDPGISFRTTRGTANRVDLVMDEGSSHDKVSFVGKTALKNIFVQIIALDGEDANLLLFSGTSYSLLSHNANDDFVLMATAEDKDMIFSINHGSVITEVLRFEGLTGIAKFPFGFIDMTHVSTADGDASLHMTILPNGYDDISAIEINYDMRDFDHTGAIGTILDVILDNSGATAGDLHALDVALSDPSNTLVEIEAVATHEGVSPIHQYIGDSAILGSGWSNDSGVFTDRTAEFNGGGDVELFVANNDYILIAATAKWDEINVLLSVMGSHSIVPVFEYSVDDGSWVPFTPADDTDGFSSNGTIRFESENLITWGQRTINEVTGEAGAVDYYWVRITRTRALLLPTPPTEDTIKVTTIGHTYMWHHHGELNIKTVAVDDGIAVPDAIAGQAIIYVDIADGDLKIRFGDGVIKTIMVDV